MSETAHSTQPDDAEALFEQFLGAAYTDLAEAESIAIRIEHLAAGDDERIRALALRARGPLHLNRANYADAVRCYESALDILSNGRFEMDIGRRLSSILPAMTRPKAGPCAPARSSKPIMTIFASRACSATSETSASGSTVTPRPLSSIAKPPPPCARAARRATSALSSATSQPATPASPTSLPPSPPISKRALTVRLRVSTNLSPRPTTTSPGAITSAAITVALSSSTPPHAYTSA